MKQLTCVIWVCACCMLSHANGECCDSDDHGGDGREPWSQLDAGDEVTMGMLYSEHGEWCDFRKEGYFVPDGYECDCETREFSWSSCSGCGSTLGGARYAFTLWWNED